MILSEYYRNLSGLVDAVHSLADLNTSAAFMKHILMILMFRFVIFMHRCLEMFLNEVRRRRQVKIFLRFEAVTSGCLMVQH